MFPFVAKKTIDLSPNKELGNYTSHTLTTFFFIVARNRPSWYFMRLAVTSAEDALLIG